jgi:DNA polymerase-3 subunit epsilon
MSNKVIYLDVETSGIDPQKHAIVQVAWITEVDGRQTGEGNLLVQPPLEAAVDPDAMAIHGITQAELNESGVSVTSAVTTLRDDWARIINKYDRSDKATLCAYNLRFDFDFLRAMFERSGDTYLGSWIQFGRWLDPMYVATFAQHVGLMPRTENLKLSTIAQALSIPNDDAHDALADIRMTRAVIRRLTNMVKSEGDDHGF